jgi:putative membrane protein
MTGAAHDIRHGPHHAAGSVDAWAVMDLVVALILVAAGAAYGVALVLSHVRRPWPRARTGLWFLGLACAGVGLVGPLADAARSSFTVHMVGHLLLGMLAPLLLVLGAPVTLLLRALPVTAARRLARVLRSPAVRVVTHPVVALTLNAGGLWVLYATDLYAAMHDSALVHGGVHAHVVLAGYLFTASVVGVDPDPHRASVPTRSAALVLFVTAHSVLAKWLYAHPPAGVPTAEGRAAAQLMYYGGDLVDIVLIVLLLAGWYRSGSRIRHSAPLPALSVPQGDLAGAILALPQAWSGRGR